MPHLMISHTTRTCGVAHTTLQRTIRRSKLLLGSPGVTLAGWLLLVLLVGTAVAGPFEDALEAYARGDYIAAARGFRQTAEQGNADAQFNLGVMYDNGLGVPQNDATAVQWYRKAAEQGNAAAQFNLGVMYDSNRGVPQDATEAVRWYHQAAEQGIASAQINLGVMYAKGEGVPQNYVQAYKWFHLAAFRFSASAAEHRTLAVQNRHRVAAQMTPAQVAEAQKLAREWRLKVAERAAPLPSLPRDLILHAQEQLKSLGYKPGPRDGMLGAQTREALHKYQTDNELPVTGTLNEATREALGLR